MNETIDCDLHYLHFYNHLKINIISYTPELSLIPPEKPHSGNFKAFGYLT